MPAAFSDVKVTSCFRGLCTRSAVWKSCAFESTTYGLGVCGQPIAARLDGSGSSRTSGDRPQGTVPDSESEGCSAGWFVASNCLVVTCNSVFVVIHLQTGSNSRKRYFFLFTLLRHSLYGSLPFGPESTRRTRPTEHQLSVWKSAALGAGIRDSEMWISPDRSGRTRSLGPAGRCREVWCRR